MTTDPNILALLREIVAIRKALNTVERLAFELAGYKGPPAEGWAEQVRKKFETVK